MSNYKSKLGHINTLIFDYDGVMTDGKVYLSEEGVEMRTGYAKDGMILHLLAKKKIRVAIISGSRSKSIENRCKGLGIELIYTGVSDKKACLIQLMQEQQIDASQIMYMGDDLPDIPVLETVGLATCPSDASVEVKNICDYISEKPGGYGCVRDICEQFMKIHGIWMDKDAYYW